VSSCWCLSWNRHDNSTSRFSQFANSLKKLRKWSWVCFFTLICVPVVIHGGSGKWFWSVPLQASSLTQFATVLDFTCVYAFCHNATIVWVSWAWFRVYLISSYFQDIKFWTFNNVSGLRSRYSYSLRAGRCGHRILVGARFSAPVHTGPGAHPASCTIGTGSFPGVKQPGRGVKHPPPCSAEVKERVLCM